MGITLLPDDILLEIMGYTYPTGVVAIGETCKHLHRLSSQRCIWERLIKAMCRERDLFLASFPLRVMTLRDLQRAAFAPDLWKRIVQRNSQLPDFVKSASLPKERHARWRDEFIELGYLAELALVPGGRYLFAAGFESYEDDSPIALGLYDLGVPGGRLHHASRLVSSYRLKSSGRFSPSTHSFTASIAISNDSSLDVVVFTKLSTGIGSAKPDIDYTVTALSITPVEVDAEFTLLSTISIIGGIDFSRSEMRPSISSGQALLDMDDRFFVWAYKSDWYKAWHCRTDGLLLTEFPSFTGRFVVAHGHDSVAIWDVDNRQTTAIPVKGPIQLLNGERSRYLIPDYTVKYPHMDDSESRRGPDRLAITTPTTSNRLPIVFDAVVGRRGYRMSLDFADPSSTSQARFAIQAVADFESACRFALAWSPSPQSQLGFGASSTVIIQYGNDFKQLLYSLVPSEASPKSPSEFGLAATLMVADLVGDDLGCSYVTVCPSSGRMIFSVHELNDELEQRDGVQVVEFVP